MLPHLLSQTNPPVLSNHPLHLTHPLISRPPVTAKESGVDAAVENKFPGADVTYGSAATGREIPPEQGGGLQRGTGRITKGVDFEKGEAGEGPEDVARRKIGGGAGA
jgi:hypothetical protein